MKNNLYQVLRKIPDVTEEEAKQVAMSVIDPERDPDRDRAATKSDIDKFEEELENNMLKVEERLSWRIRFWSGWGIIVVIAIVIYWQVN